MLINAYPPFGMKNKKRRGTNESSLCFDSDTLTIIVNRYPSSLIFHAKVLCTNHNRKPLPSIPLPILDMG